jgi:hypothetical protein
MEYKCIVIKASREETEKMLNDLAKQGWRVITSYARQTNWLILEREIII